MSLLDLKTNLKSLKYGSDQPGGGSSGLPYIQTRIPPQDLATIGATSGPGNTNPIYRIQSTGNLDFPIRGGELQFNLGTQTFTLSSQIDKSRIKKFFEDKPRGTAFLQKQIGLNLTNPKIETGNSFQVVPGSNIIPGLLENTRIYNNGINTLTQVGAQGTGVHLPRHGVFPFDYASKYYKDIVGAQNINNNSSTNRLLILQNLKLNTSSANTSANSNLVNKLGISFNRNLLFQYLGGPGSVYGVGSTTIKRYDDTSRAVRKFGSSVGMTYDAIMSQKLNNTTNGSRTKKLQNYKTGKPIESREEFYKFSLGPGDSDKMNTLSSFMFNNTLAPWETTDPEAANKTKDIIKFVFEAIDNNNPQQSWAIFFRAMLSGFSDNHQASINAFKYQGRGEDFYTYQGVSRAISFSFKIAVGTEQEQKPLYTKLNHLISQVYPDYSQDLGIMRAPVVRLTIGDYLYRVAGMLESVNITIDDNSSWEIASSDNIKQLPHIVNVQCSFKPIQDFLPRRENMYNTNVPFIGEQNSSENKDYLSILGAEEESMSPTEEKTLKYNPPEKVNPFESQFERDIRTGNFFEVFRQDR
jgi:hypothetical protein